MRQIARETGTLNSSAKLNLSFGGLQSMSSGSEVNDTPTVVGTAYNDSSRQVHDLLWLNFHQYGRHDVTKTESSSGPFVRGVELEWQRIEKVGNECAWHRQVKNKQNFAQFLNLKTVS